MHIAHVYFQLFVTLYLLYTQIGWAFLGGVIFAVILIPITRWLANKISAISKEFLEAKDARVSVTYETLSGAKQIKILAWEDLFIDKIQSKCDSIPILHVRAVANSDMIYVSMMTLDKRKLEMAALTKQKYLDALCVFFWAITPTIIKLLTFATSTVVGQPLTAATAFASVALLNMLIGPLNAFPWFMNGLVEAYVSLKRVQSYIDVRRIISINFMRKSENVF